MNVPTTLPFFNGTQKQATLRDGSPCLIYSPRTQLPPFQIQRPHDADTNIQSIDLVDCDGNDSDILDYFFAYGGYVNGPGTFQAYDTLTVDPNNRDITSCIKTTTGAGTASLWNRNAFEVADGDKIYVYVDLTLNSGAAPFLELTESAAPHNPRSNQPLLVDGENNVVLTATSADTVHLSFYVATGNQTNFSAIVVIIKRASVHEFTSVDYIQYNGEPLILEAPELIEGFTNFAGFPYDTLTTDGTEVTSAIYAGAEAYFDSTETFPITEGETFTVAFNLTLNSGQAPLVYFGGAGFVRSNQITVSAGVNVITLIATVTVADAKLTFENSANTNFETSPIILYRKDIDLLPRGTHYVKLTDGTNEWYSEWINIQNVYENLISSLVNVDYETFISNGTKAISVIETGSDGKFFSQAANPFTIANDEVVTVIFFLTLNSGQLPEVRVINASDASSLTNGVTASEGVNEIDLTATFAATGRLRFQNTAASNYSTSEIWVKRKYSSRFVKLQFTNTNDLRGKRDDDQTILYQESFEQECWLNTRLNTPGSNRVNVGEEKDGVFIPEKIATQYKYRIIDYINRSLFEGLIRLPQHDDITIIDEVGNEYTPDIGNVEVSADWTTFDTGDVNIEFNDGSFLWTENSDDIT